MSYRTQRILKMISCHAAPPEGQWARPGTVDGPMAGSYCPSGGGSAEATWTLHFHIKLGVIKYAYPLNARCYSKGYPECPN